MPRTYFKVSAKTAMRFGRENVSNAESALVELVKNSYDADASLCAVYVDNKYNSIPNLLTTEDYNYLIVRNKDHNILKHSYTKSGDEYTLVSLNEDELAVLTDFFKKQNKIIIADSGEGMTDSIIENHWMTIGTSVKEEQIYSTDGRVRTGAKGIGRFALDRLGANCIITTKSRITNKCYSWSITWDEFEATSKPLDQIFIDYDEIEDSLYSAKVESIIEAIGKPKHTNDLKKLLNSGTLIEIENLRDEWEPEDLRKLYSNLKSLVPPIGINDFEPYFFSSLLANEFGKIEKTAFDDYDYKLEVSVDDKGNANLIIYRNEFDANKLPDDLFKIESMKKYPFDLNTFKKGSFSIPIHVSKMLPGLDSDLLNSIGPFSMTLYFLKRQAGKADQEKYMQKDINVARRDAFINHFGGIKIYRDNFIVRPYGEIKGTAYDWLSLGERASRSPAAPSHKSGSWRVRTNQVCGLVSISRIFNVGFEDKSSREGVQENKTFIAFKNLLISFIQKMEEDRQTIMRAMDLLYNKTHIDETQYTRAKELAKQITRKKKTRNRKGPKGGDTLLLAQSLLRSEQEKEELISEIKMVRALASTGLAVASFSHELTNLKTLLDNDRLLNVINFIKPHLSEETVKTLKDYQNPILLLTKCQKDDEKLRQWLTFALNAVRTDRRKRRKLDLVEMLNELIGSWQKTLENYRATIQCSSNLTKKIYMRIFPIDFDSIFNNLIANSIDAFTSRRANTKERLIKIYLSESKIDDKSYAIFNYEDSGPGLDESITDSEVILKPFFTTKLNNAGDEIGTGLGMWIVKNTLDEYNAQITISKERPGFRIQFKLPISES